MIRYELRERGVFDRETGEVVTSTSPAWPRYEAWLAAGNAPALIPDPTLEDRRESARRRVNGARDRAFARLVVGFRGRRVRADDRSVATLAALVAVGYGEKTAAALSWRAEDNRPLELAPGEAPDLLAAMLSARAAILAASWALKDEAIAASESPESIDLDAALGGG